MINHRPRAIARAGAISPVKSWISTKSSYIRFQAAMPNECWQSDFTHDRLADGGDVKVLSCLDDCTRHATPCTAPPAGA